LYPVWINLQSLTDPGMSGFLYGLARIIARCPSLAQRVPVPVPEAFRDQPGAAFDEFLDQISAAIDPGLLVLMLDEFEALEVRVEHKTIGPEVFEYLRHQMQSRCNVTFILSGVHRLDDMSSAYRSIVDTLALHREIGFMEHTDAERLIREPVAPIVTYENLVVEQIWRLTHGHPYFIQLLCHIMISDMNRRADSNFIRSGHLTVAVERLLNENYAQLREIWKSVCLEDQVVLAAVADVAAGEDDPVSCGAVAAALSPEYLTEDQMLAALNRLVAHSLLAPADLGKPVGPETDYRFAFDLLRLWVTRQHPLPSVLRELRAYLRHPSHLAADPYSDRYEEVSNAV
jgi:hypothetical protein